MLVGFHALMLRGNPFYPACNRKELRGGTLGTRQDNKTKFNNTKIRFYCYFAKLRFLKVPMKRKFLLHYVKELLSIILFIQKKNFVHSRKEFCSFKKKMTGIQQQLIMQSVT